MIITFLNMPYGTMDRASASGNTRIFSGFIHFIRSIIVFILFIRFFVFVLFRPTSFSLFFFWIVGSRQRLIFVGFIFVPFSCLLLNSSSIAFFSGVSVRILVRPILLCCRCDRRTDVWLLSTLGNGRMVTNETTAGASEDNRIKQIPKIVNDAICIKNPIV